MKRMITFRLSMVNLLGLYLIFSEDHTGCCLETVWQLPSPSITHLQNISKKQSLVVSWLVNHSSLVGDFYEIQIGRTENHTVIYNRNLSLSPVDSDKHTFTWTSDVPLECVDHSVRIRLFYNQSVSSPWSSWKTHYGFQAENRSKIFPLQQVMREHATAIFCCVPSRGVNINSMTFNNSKYPLFNIGDRVKAITVHNLTIPTTRIKRLTLTCHDTTGKPSYAWNYISFPPLKPRNISCLTSDMTTVICTWDPGRKRDQYDPNKQSHTLHIENSDQAPIKCQQFPCTFSAVPQLEEYNISVVVKDKLGEAMESYTFNLSERVFPVVEVKTVSPGATDTAVSWVVHGNLTRLNLLCQVTADPDRTTQVSCNNVSGHCKVKLEHLLPNTHYSTRVRCSLNGRLWGKWTQPISFTTYPLVTLDVWRRIKQLPDPNSRQVTLLWIPHAPGSAVKEIIKGYDIKWSQEGKNWTDRKDSGQNQADVFINGGQYEFTVHAVVLSNSSVPAHITIPSQRENGEILPVTKRLSSSAAAGFNLSWDEQHTVTCGYTVEWCILGNAEPCVLRWLKVPEGNNTLSLAAGNFKAGHRYTFNIYGCTENGHRLLEVQTGYSQEQKSVRSPELVEPVQRTSFSVTLEWRYNEDDPAHPAFITGYLVTVESDTLPGHAANRFNVSVADPHKKSVTIEGLQQNQEYAFSVSALTKEGPGQPTSIIIRTRTNYSAHLVKILTPILLLLGCIILLWPRREMLKSGLKEVFAYPAGMNIKTPELDSFLHETGERLQSQKVEECSCCDIEIVNSRPPLDETLNTLPSPGSKSFSPTLPLQVDYCPQSVTVSWDTPDLQQITCITNKTYLPTAVEDLSEAEGVTEIKSSCETSESLLESCSVIYGYISNDNL
ncbi:leukemia inhibitory factor receptor isoform X1 [Epinephelus fuscoguttatus]|uniref:leukemia inhibitory factor receptor isoform X1 n=1 Tax=Epinephelus fuscoguttatus TaxID=293821 RepID=UPI0020D05FC1|nr:leukemia inhibitory factor receptor isoform X1 [Epinephelus fuscoguttatus]